MKTVSINFEYGKEEYVSGVKSYYEISKSFGLTERWLITFALGGCFILLSRGGFTIPNLIVTGIVLLMSFWAFWLYTFKPANDFKRAEKFANNFSFVFSKEKIAFSSQKASCDFQWKIFKKLFETDDFFYLAQSKGSYTMIPKRAFASVDEITAFKSIVGQGSSKMEYIDKTTKTK